MCLSWPIPRRQLFQKRRKERIKWVRICRFQGSGTYSFITDSKSIFGYCGRSKNHCRAILPKFSTVQKMKYFNEKPKCSIICKFKHHGFYTQHRKLCISVVFSLKYRQCRKKVFLPKEGSSAWEVKLNVRALSASKTSIWELAVPFPPFIS